MKRFYLSFLIFIFFPTSIILAQLSACYAAPNWTIDIINTNSTFTNITENAIIMEYDTDQIGTNLDFINCSSVDGLVKICISAPASGDITFDWSVPDGNDFNPLVEKFGYCINGVSTELTSINPAPLGTSEGMATVTVSAGDEFCFVAASKFSDGFGGLIIIDDFTFPACPPPPLSDCYEATNWSSNTTNTNGSIVADETFIIINSDTDFSGTNLDEMECANSNGNVSYCITIPTAGDFTFDWSAQGDTSFYPLVERFGYCLNGVATELTSAAPAPFGTSNGTTTIAVSAGDELCFIAASKFADEASSTTYTINNFILPECSTSPPSPPFLSDCYDPSNWIINNINTNGNVVIADSTIFITGDNDGSGTNLDSINCASTNGNVSYCISVPSTGEITFNWGLEVGSFFNPFEDKFGYCLNGIAMELTSASPPPFGTNSGTETISVSEGDELCFIVVSKFANSFDQVVYKIENLILPECPIPPLSICYDASNWNVNTANTSGSVLIDGNNIVLNGDKDGTGTGLDELSCSATNGIVSACISIPVTGEISFDWSGQSGAAFNPSEEKFGYCLNGVATELTSLNPSPNGTSSGHATIQVSSGDELCFVFASKNADHPNYDPYTLTNFEVTLCEDVFAAIISASPDTLACFGDANGSILVTPFAGDPDYVYVWDNATISGNNPTNLAAGIYCVTVTDGQGEIDSTCIEIFEPTILTASTMNDSNVSCNNGSDGVATVTAVGGTLEYSYLWDNGETTATADSLSAGTHLVTVTDANGCETSAFITLSEPDALTISMSSTPAFDLNANGTATATVGGGTSSYSYLWDTDPVQIGQIATGLTAGIYFVTVTDDNGCEITGGVAVQQSTGVKDFSEISNMNVFPNPTSEKIFLEIDFIKKMDISIQIFNSLGQEMSNLNLKNVNTVQEIFDLKKNPSGIYWIFISSGDKRIIRKVVLR